MHSSQGTVEEGQGESCQLMKLVCGPMRFMAREMWEERHVSAKGKVDLKSEAVTSLCLDMV